MNHRFLIIIVSVLFILTSCNKEEEVNQQDQLSLDIAKIESYLETNNLDAQHTESGIYYIITDAGTGGHPDIDNTVTVQYKGTLLNGTEFDANTASFPLGSVIRGWQEGIPLFKTKGRGKLIIPSTLGYGSSGSGPIPPNSVLIFDIYLISYSK
jgi:FKBP-type peptidyl-prolyl cis-trans isomerase FkpA